MLKIKYIARLKARPLFVVLFGFLLILALLQRKKKQEQMQQGIVKRQALR
jgi:hypothetical protein